MFWLLYSIKLYVGVTISISCALSISLLLILLMHLVNVGQFLNMTPLFFLSALLAVAWSPTPVIGVVILTLIHQ